MSGWVWLLAAGLVEIVWSQSIEPTEGFSRPAPTALCFVLGGTSVYLLSRAMETVPVGTAYVVFTGLGGAGAVLLGLLRHGEPLTVLRFTGLLLVLGGAVLCHAGTR